MLEERDWEEEVERSRYDKHLDETEKGAGDEAEEEDRNKGSDMDEATRGGRAHGYSVREGFRAHPPGQKSSKQRGGGRVGLLTAAPIEECRTSGKFGGPGQGLREEFVGSDRRGRNRERLPHPQ
ncbi:hypothetical protein NDU88_002928 [Pleurodeles waltl]|uniref:Uncharacterized protein n=1 Tax=Pleurodeles waltl TaxID=8319 RepID=A0AAV7QE30_PLEWA|nr:hypothetical protein NDU88_002928 [Pleurodeles waltl]